MTDLAYWSDSWLIQGYFKIFYIKIIDEVNTKYL